jgi:hypothetical protein
MRAGPAKRSKFAAASDDHPRITAWILLITGRIYQIKTRLREQRSGPHERQKNLCLETRRLHVSVAKSSPYRTAPILLASRHVCIELAPESGK